MNVALLSASYAPEPTGIGPYSSELAQTLAGRGHHLRVITAFPFYPDWKQRVPPGIGMYQSAVDGAVHITRCRLYVPRNPRPAKRLMHELSWALAALKPVLAARRWADAWIVVSPAFGSALLGAYLARFLSARVHLHVQDLVPDVALESGQLGFGPMHRLAQALAGWTYRSFRSASVLSDSMAVRLRRYTGKTEVRTFVAPNWVRQGSSGRSGLPDRLRRRSYAVYAGSFGRKQDLALLVQTSELLAARGGPLIVVLGDGPGRELLPSGLENLVWLGLVDGGTYSAVLQHAIAGIVALGPKIGASVVPSKLAGYMAARRPVVVAADADSEAVRVVERAQCGYAVPAGRADLLAERLSELAGDPGMRDAFGRRAAAYAEEHWSRDRVVDRIEDALKDVSA